MLVYFSRLCSAGVVVTAIFWLCSCQPIYYLHPQPTDRKDLHRFPRSLRGDWVQSKDDSSDIGSVIIGDDSTVFTFSSKAVKMVAISHKRIIPVALPAQDTGAEVYRSEGYDTDVFYELNANGRPMDSKGPDKEIIQHNVDQ